MSSTSNLATDITPLIQEYYERKALKERVFESGLLGDAQRADIPQKNSDVAHFHRWNKFALAETVTDGNDPVSPIAADVTEIKVQTEILASSINIPTDGDIIRIDPLTKQAYPKFTEQLERTANRKAILAVSGGSSASGGASGSFSAATTRYANGKATWTDLGVGDQLRSKDIQRAVGFLRQNGAIPFEGGMYKCLLNPWGHVDLMAEDSEFRTILSRIAPDALKKGEIGMWAGCKFGWQDEPMRETLGGTENTYSGTGAVHTTYVYGRDAFGVTQLMGKTGLTPKFKVQDITTTGAKITIGWRTRFAFVVLNNVWIVAIKAVSSDASVASVA